MGMLAQITEPKRLGWWAFRLWLFFAIYVCYILQLVAGGGIVIIHHLLFLGMAVISALLSLLIPGVTAIKQRAFRISFKLVVVASFLGSIYVIKKIKFLSRLQLMIGGCCSTLGGSSPFNIIVGSVLIALAYVVPFYFIVAVLASGEFDSEKA